MRCPRCHSRLPSPTAFCLNCGRKNALGAGIYYGIEKIHVLFVGEERDEAITFRIYEDTLENTFEVVAERLHDRRVDRVFVSSPNLRRSEECAEILRRVVLAPTDVKVTDPFESPEDFFEHLRRYLRAVRSLRVVEMRPEEKIQGAHSTVIGGREGMEFLMTVAKSGYVKKIVPGVIEAKGTAQGGGVRFKLTRCDDRGNVRALLIDGSSVQEIHIVTTARNREEGEVILKILRGMVEGV